MTMLTKPQTIDSRHLLVVTHSEHMSDIREGALLLIRDV